MAALIEAAGHRVELVVIKTGGDRLQERPLSEIGDKRLFVKEIEDALLAEDVDIAVHSAKDMSATLPDGLEIAAVLPREDPRDALVLHAGTTVADFAAALSHVGETATIATSSIRRVAQLAGVLPGATFAPTRAALQSAGDAPAAIALLAERTVVNALGGGCQLPLGAIAINGGGLTMHGVVATPDGKRVIRRSVEGTVSDPAGLGAKLADELARGGAMEILDAVRR